MEWSLRSGRNVATSPQQMPLNLCRTTRTLPMTSSSSRLGMTRRTAVFSLALASAGFATSAAFAQAKYPDHPVRVILPFGAGGVADVTSRLVAEALSNKLGQNFVI